MFSPYLQDVFRLGQQLSPICLEEGPLSIKDVLGVMVVCSALDFFGLLALPGALHHNRIAFRPDLKSDLYSPRNDPDHEMIPNPEMIPKLTPK